MPSLEPEDLVELRRSIGVVRRLVGRSLAQRRWRLPANDDGPVGTDRGSPAGTAGQGVAPGPSLLLAWVEFCHAAAGDLLGEPTADMLRRSGDRAVDGAELLVLLDEVEQRLDRLQGRTADQQD